MARKKAPSSTKKPVLARAKNAKQTTKRNSKASAAGLSVFTGQLRKSKLLLPVLAVVFIGIFAMVGYQLHFFGHAATVTQRFPGDPNPLASGKTYWGIHTTESTVGKTSYETAAGKALGVDRKYSTTWSGINAGGKLIQDVANDRKNNRLPWVSMKAPCQGWKAVANGNYDSGTNGLDQFLQALDKDGSPVWLSVSHEPENDLGTPDTSKCIGTSGGNHKYGTAADWLSMQKHVRARMKALGIKHVAFGPVIMCYTFQAKDRDINDWYAADTWDFWGQDCYQPKSTGTMFDTQWPNAVKFAKSKNLPIAIGEWGMDNSQNDTTEAAAIQGFLDKNFSQGNDIIAFCYFDNFNWTLSGAPLQKFDSILKNDTRLMHVSDLGSDVTPTPPPAPVDKTPPTISFAAPAANATVSALTTITANAADNIGVTKVDFYVDGTTVIKNDTDASDAWWAQWDTTKVNEGQHTLKIVATDAAGNSANVTRTVTVKNDTTAPSVSFVTPVGGATVRGVIDVTANAADNVGVNQVDFYVDSRVIKNDLDPSDGWTTRWGTQNDKNGTHTLKIVATDASGNSKTITRSVTIKN